MMLYTVLSMSSWVPYFCGLLGLTVGFGIGNGSVYLEEVVRSFTLFKLVAASAMANWAGSSSRM